MLIFAAWRCCHLLHVEIVVGHCYHQGMQFDVVVAVQIAYVAVACSSFGVVVAVVAD